jgi:hypothetical protein
VAELRWYYSGKSCGRQDKAGFSASFLHVATGSSSSYVVAHA